ncbi:substrate-binding domain-containing protein [Paraburkholderia sp. Ac-20336]|uniref:LacI family DNA-binding transcriptional regulator n=1 Tax=Burkholderiaceae TaxID=119060 RepID=UPI001420A32D|nr:MULTISPECIES: LacI family DNA-binding transcriptional regulator [Burkholderiaceae]MBN3803852.1 substrate-binding domain-containing protein [Paraburkholderia sp. Ac-20336]MBN3850283.1 substrate-binding domain-containing protein [Paraburkholderia sp. Ac-20342]NIF52857.1 substrate-binding domain-containing protein [Burkholderia sp. Ax-1724]
MTKKPSVTIRDIAAQANVSVSTVSLVVRESPLVAPETRKRVLATMAELGYVHNRGAAAMRSRKSGVIAMSVNDLANPYFAGLTSSVEHALQKIDRTVLLTDVREDPQLQARFIEKMRGYNVDGLILCPAHTTDVTRLLEQLRSAPFPCVLVSRDLAGSGLDYVGYDHRRGMALAVRHLIELGHERIALLGGSHHTWVGHERLSGYREALRAAGLHHDASLEVEGELTRASGMSLLDRVLDMKTPPTAAACANDIVAFGVMLGLRRRGLEPGIDFSVTGNDDLPEAELWTPSLTTLSIDFDEIGRQAATLLLQRIENPASEVRHVSLPVQLGVRNSTRAPKSHA